MKFEPVHNDTIKIGEAVLTVQPKWYGPLKEDVCWVHPRHDGLPWIVPSKFKVLDVEEPNFLYPFRIWTVA